MPITQILLTATTAQGGGGGIDYTFPPAGGDNYLADASSLGFVNSGLQGTAYDPGSGVDSVPNALGGCMRKRIQGNLGSFYGSPGPSPFNQFTQVNAINDVTLGFGFINAGNQENYALEWVGYWRAPTTGDYNFVIQSNDRAWFWIGNNALSGVNFWNNPHVSSDNGANLNSNSVSLVANKWYPIRIWFQEFSGAEYCQLYAASVGQTPINMLNYETAFNSSTFGH